MKKIKVLGRTYSIEYTNLDPDTYGEAHGHKAILKINRDASLDQQRKTLIHELIHAILFESGMHSILDPGVEEGIVVAVEHGLVRSGIIKKFEL